MIKSVVISRFLLQHHHIIQSTNEPSNMIEKQNFKAYRAEWYADAPKQMFKAYASEPIQIIHFDSRLPFGECSFTLLFKINIIVELTDWPCAKSWYPLHINVAIHNHNNNDKIIIKAKCRYVLWPKETSHTNNPRGHRIHTLGTDRERFQKFSTHHTFHSNVRAVQCRYSNELAIGIKSMMRRNVLEMLRIRSEFIAISGIASHKIVHSFRVIVLREIIIIINAFLADWMKEKGNTSDVMTLSVLN